MSSHRLNIETGRYGINRLEPEDRVCHICNTCEDEKHFVINCTSYNAERKILFDVIGKVHEDFHLLDDVSKFICIMSSNNTNVVNELGKYITRCMKIRNNTILN